MCGGTFPTLKETLQVIAIILSGPVFNFEIALLFVTARCTFFVPAFNRHCSYTIHSCLSINITNSWLIHGSICQYASVLLHLCIIVPDPVKLSTIRIHIPNPNNKAHYSDIIMGAMASQITSLRINSTVYSGANQRKHQSSASLAFVRGIHRSPMNSRTNGQLRGKSFHLMTASW